MTCILSFLLSLSLPLQVMYCSSECRQAAAEQYHRVLCLGPSQEDPDHPINKLKDAWRWESFVQICSRMCCFFSLMRRLTLMDITCLLFRSMHYPPETSSIMLMARMVAAVKQVSLSEVCEVLVCALLLQAFLQNKALDFCHSLLIVPYFKYELHGV